MKVYEIYKDCSDFLLLALPKANGKLLGICYCYDGWSNKYTTFSELYMHRKTISKKQLKEFVCVGDTEDNFVFDMSEDIATSSLERKDIIFSPNIPIAGQSQHIGIQVVSDGLGSYITLNNRSS